VRTFSWPLRLTAAIVAVTTFAGCSDSAQPPDVAATVEGATIRGDDVERLVGRFIPDDADAGAEQPLPRGEARRVVLNYLIRYELLDHLARQAGITPATDVVDAAVAALAPEDFAAAGIAPSDLTDALLAGEMSRQLAELQFPHVAVSDSELEAMYDRSADRFAAGWTARVRAAFFADAALAEDFVETSAGADTFDETAVDVGATQAGSMGSVTNLAELPTEIIDLLQSHPVGRLTEPIEATGGWIVFLIESRTPHASRSFGQARAELTADVEDRRRQELFEAWFDDQLRASAVDVDDFYGDWDPGRGAVTA
jgi:hypothetical protein